MLTLEELDRVLAKASKSRPADPAKPETENNEPAPAATVAPAEPAPGPYDKKAKAAGWLILAPGEAYEYPLSKNHAVYLFREDDGNWTAWRASWLPGKPEPYKEKTMAERVPFDTAWTYANEYLTWFQRHKRSA